MTTPMFTVSRSVGVAFFVALASWAAGCAQADDAGPEESLGEQELAIGDTPCKAFINGQPNPAWPECLSTGPTIPAPTCAGISTCYCFCRYNHRCDTTPSQCGPLSQCLTNCDAQYPNCPYPGGGFPNSLSECL